MTTSRATVTPRTARAGQSRLTRPMRSAHVATISCVWRMPMPEKYRAVSTGPSAGRHGGGPVLVRGSTNPPGPLRGFPHDEHAGGADLRRVRLHDPGVRPHLDRLPNSEQG